MRKVQILALILLVAAPSFALVAPPSRADSMTAVTKEMLAALKLQPDVLDGGPGGEGER